MSGFYRNPKHFSLVALALLILQNTSLVLLMRYSLTQGYEYLTSTAVMVMEVLKLVVCLTIVYMETGGSPAFLKKLRVDVANRPMEMVKLAIPAVLYTAQNNLLFIALSNLDAATYSVCYQTKILTTALFSVVLLKKRLNLRRWAALFLLAIGVAMAQLSGVSTTHRIQEDAIVRKQSPLLGFLCILTAACTSGFSGVYFEMILKSSRTSLWIRNIQMGIPSIALSFFGVLVQDWSSVLRNGFFHGYNSSVVGVIILQATGGLVVAVVVKYTDNIRKSFATAVSIVTSCILSMVLFEFRPNRQFMLGVVFVCGSIFIYSRPSLGKDLPTFHKRVGVLGFSSHEGRRRSVTRRI